MLLRVEASVGVFLDEFADRLGSGVPLSATFLGGFQAVDQMRNRGIQLLFVRGSSPTEFGPGADSHQLEIA